MVAQKKVGGGITTNKDQADKELKPTGLVKNLDLSAQADSSSRQELKPTGLVKNLDLWWLVDLEFWYSGILACCRFAIWLDGGITRASGIFWRLFWASRFFCLNLDVALPFRLEGRSYSGVLV